jgi:hypothetical protein
LNTLLAEKAAQLALAENQLFRIFCRWDGVDYDSANVVVTYPQRFELAGSAGWSGFFCAGEGGDGEDWVADVAAGD